MRPFLLLFHYPSVLVKLSTLYSFFTMSMNSFEAFFPPNFHNRLDHEQPVGTCERVKTIFSADFNNFSNLIPPIWRNHYQNSLRWACVDSNHGPLHYQCNALTT
jgi:hypothetical protein